MKRPGRKKHRMRRKKITEFDITKAVLLFEREFYTMSDKLPKKYRYDLVQQTKDALGYVKRLTGKSIRLIPTTHIEKEAKVRMLNEAYSEFSLIEMNLCQLNDIGVLSDRNKTRTNIMLYDIYGNFERLISSMTKNSKEADAGDTNISGRDQGFIRTPDCDGEGGSNA